ncbi:hypothetical protein E2562_012334 [Oryza meyeriana var. granulata]|uniref:Uncharacterized protein n=1 Tax=Oryza meyeriana var. granulata TaxID=110450 RepID=A0A6G1DHG8_9ORYZ|nr:hypothetical protein E2562_012334 [Oryza meyeriana var. granulata]
MLRELTDIRSDCLSKKSTAYAGETQEAIESEHVDDEENMQRIVIFRSPGRKKALWRGLEEPPPACLLRKALPSAVEELLREPAAVRGNDGECV